MLAGIIGEAKGAGTMPMYKGEEKEKITEIVLEKAGPISKYLGEKPYLIGENLVYLDFYIYEMCQAFNWISDGKLFETYPNLAEHNKRMYELPAIKKMQDEITPTNAPFNMKFAKHNNWEKPADPVAE